VVGYSKSDVHDFVRPIIPIEEFKEGQARLRVKLEERTTMFCCGLFRGLPAISRGSRKKVTIAGATVMRVNTLMAELDFAVSAFKSALPMEQRVAQPTVSRVVADNDSADFARTATMLKSHCR
jgi:hypothetical protein